MFWVRNNLYQVKYHVKKKDTLYYGSLWCEMIGTPFHQGIVIESQTRLR